MKANCTSFIANFGNPPRFFHFFLVSRNKKGLKEIIPSPEMSGIMSHNEWNWDWSHHVRSSAGICSGFRVYNQIHWPTHRMAKKRNAKGKEKKRAKSALRMKMFVRKKELQELHAGMIRRAAALDRLGMRIAEEDKYDEQLADISGGCAAPSIACYPERSPSPEQCPPAHHSKISLVHNRTIRPEDIAEQLKLAEQAKASIKEEHDRNLRARAAASARRASTILQKCLRQWKATVAASRRLAAVCVHLQLGPILVCPETPPPMQAMCQHAKDRYGIRKISSANAPRILLLCWNAYYAKIWSIWPIWSIWLNMVHHTINTAQYGQNGSIWMWM